MRISDWSSDVCSSDRLSMKKPDAKVGLFIYSEQAWRSAVQHRLVAHRTLVGAGGEQGVGLERRRHLTGAWLGGLPAFLVLLDAAVGQLFIADLQLDAAVGDVDQHLVAVLHQPDGAARSRFRRGEIGRAHV